MINLLSKPQCLTRLSSQHYALALLISGRDPNHLLTRCTMKWPLTQDSSTSVVNIASPSTLHYSAAPDDADPSSSMSLELFTLYAMELDDCVTPAGQRRCGSGWCSMGPGYSQHSNTLRTRTPNIVFMNCLTCVAVINFARNA